MIIRNSNGYDYEILARHGLYVLLTNCKSKEPVVAYNLQKNSKGEYSWGYGRYYCNLDDAREEFKIIY